MPFRLPKTSLPLFPPTGNQDLDRSLEEWRRQTNDLLKRNYEEIENFAFAAGFRAIRSTSATIVSGAPTALNLDIEQWDTDNMHDLVTNPSRGTANTAGVYAAAGHVPFKGSTAAGSFRGCAIWVNGSAPVVEIDVPPRLAGQTVAVATVTYLGAQDYLQLVVNHDAGINVGVGGSTNIFPTLAMGHLFDIPTLG